MAGATAIRQVNEGQTISFGGNISLMVPLHTQLHDVSRMYSVRKSTLAHDSICDAAKHLSFASSMWLSSSLTSPSMTASALEEEVVVG